MRASIIVPAFNAAATVEGCLAALMRQSLPRDEYEIILVDDGSRDDTAQRAAREGVCVIRTPHCGAAAARNRGAREALGELLLFTDADCEPDENWAQRLLAPFADSRSPVAGAKGEYKTRQCELVARFVQLEYEEKYARMEGAERIDFVDTYSAAYRREIYMENGGLDESLPVDEDQEFSFRLAKQGLRLVLVPDAIVYHRHVTRSAAYLARKFRIGYWKARVHRLHPDKVWADSHTPPSLKIQVALMLGMIASFALAPFLTTGAWLAILFALAVLFFASALPLTRFMLRRDRPVGLVAPLLIIGRATALSVGLAAGVINQAGALAPVRRAFDIAGALLCLVITAPLWPIIAAAIKFDSAGPVIFVQPRAGKAGRPFRIFKFRTMVAGAEDMLEKVIASSHLPPPVYKVPGDPRITGVGRILRRWSLDELPQLINVLRGEMSLVGPRPEETRVAAQYNEWQERRLAARPGITGPMQVRGRGDLPLDRRVEIEMDYVRNASVWTDAWYLLRTIPAVIGRRGAY